MTAAAPTLLLLHGLAGNRSVWDPVIERLEGRWPGGIVVPDLPGHGRSPHTPPYSFGGMAAAVAASVAAATAADADRDIAVAVGHSLGGVVALALGSGWFGVRLSDVVALSVKVEWTEEELAAAAAVAAKPVSWFDTREEATGRFLKVAGLHGLVDGSSAMAGSGVVEADGRFRLAHDPATAGVGAPDMPGLLAACRARVVLGCGENDHMVRHDQLLALDPTAIELAGVGHSPHVEAPEAIAELVLGRLRSGV